MPVTKRHSRQRSRKAAATAAKKERRLHEQYLNKITPRNWYGQDIPHGWGLVTIWQDPYRPKKMLGYICRRYNPRKFQALIS